MSETRNGRDGAGRWMPGHSGNPGTQFKPGESGNPKGRQTWKRTLTPRTQAKTGPEYNQLASYRPYKKQVEFHTAGAEHDERLLMAGNQLGKTLAGGMEWAMHLTGRYPDWWKGKVFDHPVRLWASGVTAESTRDNPQRVLVGSPQQKERWGTRHDPA